MRKMPTPKLTEEPRRADRLEAIVKQLAAVDQHGQPAEWTTTDVRFLVTLLWDAHYLRISAEGAYKTIRELHHQGGGCLGCSHCDSEFDLAFHLRETESFAAWPLWPRISFGKRRDDNLLSF